MTDTTKFKALMIASTLLCVMIPAYAILQEHLVPNIEGYLQRKSYYERIIQKKDLSLQKGLYWKEKER